jgi:hypothetical protein
MIAMSFLFKLAEFCSQNKSHELQQSDTINQILQ